MREWREGVKFEKSDESERDRDTACPKRFRVCCPNALGWTERREANVTEVHQEVPFIKGGWVDINSGDEVSKNYRSRCCIPAIRRGLKGSLFAEFKVSVHWRAQRDSLTRALC